MENSGIILETKNIKKTFVTGNSEVQALKGVSFCQWVERDSPVVGSRRVCYRIDSCCYGDFSS